MLTAAVLQAAGVAPAVASTWVQPLGDACARHGVQTPARVAAFVAQCVHESAGLIRLEEGLCYRSPARICAVWPSRVPTLEAAARLVAAPEALANAVYCGRNGNGDTASGDGWRYRGRGLLQVTGRANYRAAGVALRRPYEQRPELVAQPADAALSAAWWWSAHGCNGRADMDDMDGITRTINGPGMAGAEERRALYRAVRRALHI